MSISVDDLGLAITEALKEYGLQVSSKVSAAGKAVAKEGVKSLKETSPKQSGDYANSWTYKVKPGMVGEPDRFIIHNEKHYRLTHLLENGHATKGGAGRKGARPHIKKAEELVIRRYIEKVEAGLGEIK